MKMRDVREEEKAPLVAKQRAGHQHSMAGTCLSTLVPTYVGT